MRRPMLLLMTQLVLARQTAVLGQNHSTASSGSSDDPCADHNDGIFCASCLEAVYCVGGATAASYACSPQSTVCEQVSSGIANCYTIAQATKCQCTADMCDPYDKNSLDRCNQGGIYDVADCPGCNSGDCLGLGVTTPSPGVQSCDDDVESGIWYPIAPECSSGFYCYDGGNQINVHCGSGYYVDANGNCQSGQPQPCSGCTATVCPDYTNCHQFYTCANGSPSGPAGVCPNDGFFNPTATAPPFCSTEQSVCSPLTNCDWGATSSTTTTPGSGRTTTTEGTTTAEGTTSTEGTTPVGGTTPSTECSASTVGNYPSGPCSSYYWSCRNTGGGNYQYVQMQCSNGQVFSPDPDYPYCDLPANVDTCSSKLFKR